MIDPAPLIDDDLSITPAMRRFIDYFGELGPRWGIDAETTRAHALLYLVNRPLDRDALAAGLAISRAKAAADLKTWGVASEADGGWMAGGEPWDLLVSALEARRRREVGPALEALRACSAEAQSDRATPLAVRRRINGVLGLVDNLAAIDRHARRLPATLMPRLVTLTGATSRLLSRFVPPDRRRRS